MSLILPVHLSGIFFLNTANIGLHLRRGEEGEGVGGGREQGLQLLNYRDL